MGVQKPIGEPIHSHCFSGFLHRPMDFDADFFAGEHSFELGKGRTGGIMDYGDGTLSLRLETWARRIEWPDISGAHSSVEIKSGQHTMHVQVLFNCIYTHYIYI